LIAGYIKSFFLTAFLFPIAIIAIGQDQDAVKPIPESKEIRAESLFAEGEKFFILEDYGKAIEFYKRANEIRPSASIHYKIAEALSRSEQEESLNQATIEIEQALKLDHGNKYYYLLASRIYGATGQFGKATQVLEELVKKFPGNGDQLFELSTLYQFQGKQDEALDALNRAEKIFGINETSSIRKMELLGGQGKFRQAEEEGRKLIQSFPDEPRYLTGLATLLIQQKKYDEAKALLEKINVSDDEGGYARMLLADLYLRSNQIQDCLRISLSLMGNPEIELNNKIVLIKTIQSNSNIQDPLINDGLNTMMEALKKVNPDSPEVWLTSADLNMSLGKQRIAASEYRMALRKGATAFQAWSNLLVLESQENMIDSLIHHSEEAMEFFPNQPELWYFNGFGHFKKKNFQVACSSFEQARQLSSDEKFKKELLLLLGDAYHAAGNHIKSDESFEEVLRSDPDQDLALNNYSYYLALRGQKLERAEELSSRLIKKYPSNNTYLDTYAWVLFARNKYKEARKIIEQVIQSGGASATHLEHYGDILFKLGEKEEAVRQWELALSMNSRNEALRKKILNRNLN